MSNARRSVIAEMKRVLQDSRARVLGVAITGAPAVSGYGYYAQDSAYRHAHSARSSIESEV